MLARTATLLRFSFRDVVFQELVVAFSDHLVHHEEEDTIVDQLVDRQEDDGAQGGRVREDKVTWGVFPWGSRVGVE